MPEPATRIDISAWVQTVRADRLAYRQRQATEIILHAIAMAAPLNDLLYLKGGVLMGLVYGSPRQTSDIDFSASSLFSAEENTAENFRTLMDPALQHTAAKLGYVDLVVRTQSVRELPHNLYPDARFPALELKVAYAERGSQQEKRFLAGEASHTIRLDISFNEEVGEVQVLDITDGESLLAYSLVDQIAEKYRAMLQQVSRNRSRRQDVYDLDILIQRPELNDAAKVKILETLIKKCRSRDIFPAPSSMDHPEMKSRSKAEWDTLQLDLGEIPDFEPCFERVAIFYRQLPWSDTEP
ncbi:MAG: nucleotidyl transferase AbiEii/AbiGii toxin family protein [Gammaproteobacteria bacterium]|nr:nucleotidyl transferase AbiEii/AbiGii toxin family protein [Gammaproteobacteria bacterium]